ncbi:hypothetical protein FRB91_000412 [Serendipita sp. 411]|nr:hypothetical protein FRB91_000412 [Serendipita sp. 411]
MSTIYHLWIFLASICLARSIIPSLNVSYSGIITSVRQGGHEADIKEVENLVMSFITKPSCLILLVVSCETDIENQGARQLARRVDPNGERIIPVLTKPDRIEPAVHATWVRLLENQQEYFKHGWFCVKQSNQQQLDDGISWAEARRNEIEFFEHTAPWSGLDDNIRRHLGTRTLTHSLGSILFQLICNRLPSLYQEVLRKLQAAKDAIAQLPKKLEGDPVGILWNLLGVFQRDVAQLVAGRPEDGAQGLLQLFHRYRLQFREAIFNQAPQFRPYVKKDHPLSDYKHKSMVSDGEQLEPTTQDPSTLVFLDEVMDVAANAITRELPANYPYAVKKAYVARFTAKWPPPAQVFFEKIERQFLKELKELVAIHFGQYAAGGLEKAILEIILTQLKICSTKTQGKMAECVALEHEEPMTSNEGYLAHYKTQFLASYKAYYKHPILGDRQSSTYMRNVIDNLAKMGITHNETDLLLRLFPINTSDPTIAEAAISIMAEVRAYYQVAFKRFVDYLAMIIDFNLLKGLDRTIYDALFTGLSLGKYNVRERASNFLKEDPDISRRRTILDQDLERFTNARLEFENIPDVRLSEFSDDDNKDDDDDTDTDADSLPSRKDFIPRIIASRSPSPISPKVVVREPATIARSTIRPLPAVVPIRTVNAGQILWNQHGSGANYGGIEEFEAVEVCEEIGVLYC